MSIILQLGKTRFILKYPGVETKGPVCCGLVEMKRVIAVKVFERFLSQNSEAAVVVVMILDNKFCSLKSEQMPECYE